MMVLTRGLAVAAVLCGAAVGLAGPASADPPNGTYSAVVSGQNGSSMNLTWVLTPCGPGCTSLSIGEGAPVREMHLQGNAWTASENNDGVACIWTFDDTSLAGRTGCGFATFPVQLTKTS